MRFDRPVGETVPFAVVSSAEIGWAGPGRLSTITVPGTSWTTPPNSDHTSVPPRATTQRMETAQ